MHIKIHISRGTIMFNHPLLSHLNHRIFENEDEFAEWVNLYRGKILSRHDDHYIVDFPKIHNYRYITPTLYGAAIEDFDMLMWIYPTGYNGKIRKRTRKMDVIQTIDGDVKCARIYLYQHGNDEVPARVIELTCNAKSKRQPRHHMWFDKYYNLSFEYI